MGRLFRKNCDMPPGWSWLMRLISMNVGHFSCVARMSMDAFLTSSKHAHVAGVWRDLHGGLHPALPVRHNRNLQFDHGALAALAHTLHHRLPGPNPKVRLSLSTMLPTAAPRSASDSLAKTPQRRRSLSFTGQLSLSVCVCVLLCGVTPCCLDTFGLQDLSRIARQFKGASNYRQ